MRDEIVHVPRHTRRTFLRSALALGLAAPLAACTSLPVGMPTPLPKTKSGGERTRIGVGLIPALISGPLFIALDKGYFREAGLDVELHPLWQASEMLAGLASGDLQVGTGGIGAAHMNAINRGLAVRIVAPLHTERPPVTTPLALAKRLWDSGAVRSVADLRGKRVAINSKGSATEYWLYAALAVGGLTPRDVEVQQFGFPEAVTAMENGALDAAMVGEPAATQGERRGAIVRLSEDFVSDFQVTAVYLTEPFARDHRPAGEAFTAAFLRAARDLDGQGYHAPEHLQILERHTRVPAELIGASRRPYHDRDGRVAVEDFQRLHDFFMAEGALNFTQRMDMKSLVDPSFAAAALQRLGR